MSPPVSLCLIAKDEEANLADCLRCAAGLAGEVVVDTGSADRTREVAASLGARVIDFPWRDSFALARELYQAGPGRAEQPDGPLPEPGGSEEGPPPPGPGVGPGQTRGPD